MSEEEGSQKPINDLDDEDKLDGEDLFNDIEIGEDKPDEKKGKKLKKSKKSKKEKKKEKKKRRREEELEEYDDEDEEQRNSMFEDQAESDDEEQNYSEDRSAEFGQDSGQRKRFQEMLNRPRDNYLSKFEGKNDRVINALYSRDVTKIRENEAMYPSEHDPKVYIVNVKPRHEDEIVLRLLNKARHLAETANKVTVITATSMRKKYAGKIFVEAFSEKDVRDSLQGFNDVSLGRNIIQLDREGYIELFNQKYEQKVEFQPMNFVRINKGLYEGDLAQIIKIKSSSADVIVVPRLNIKEIAMKIREQVSKIPDELKKKQKMAELLNLFLDHKSNNYKKRPTKNTITQQNLVEQLGDNPAVKKIRLSGNPPGLIILNYRYDEISRHEGTYSPIELMPFTTQGNFINKLNEEKGNLTIATSFKKGEEVQIISGPMIGHFGAIYEIVDNIAVITCKNKELRNQRIQEPVQNIVKKFKEGQRVKVISGGDAGKTGIVLKVQQKTVQIWTDNQNSIRVNKKNLEVSKAEIICEQNVHNLKKDDLIKTSKNQIGIVLQTTKDNIKILDTNNTIQIIGNMDFDSKQNSKNIVAKNKSGDEIGAGCSVIIRHGPFQGKKCKVIHVYRQNVFLFNPIFNRTAGVSVESAENCSLMSKNEPPQHQSRSFSAKGANPAIGTTESNKDEVTVGKAIIIRTGPMKGYQAIVKSIQKDKIEVRVVCKGCTEWIPRANVAPRQEPMEIGRTPNRRGGNTHSYVPSPSKY